MLILGQARGNALEVGQFHFHIGKTVHLAEVDVKVQGEVSCSDRLDERQRAEKSCSDPSGLL